MTCTVMSPQEVITAGAVFIDDSLKRHLGMEIMPFSFHPTQNIQLNRPDLLLGIQQERSALGAPPTIDSAYDRNGQFCHFSPAWFGEQIRITEHDLLYRTNPGLCPTDPLDATGEIAARERLMVNRQLRRIEKNIWDVLRTGVYVTRNSQGQSTNVQYFNIRKISPVIPFTDHLNSRPLAFLRSLPILARNNDTDFGTCTRYFANQVTVNEILANRNPEDFGRANTGVCCNTMTQEWVNQQLAANGLGNFTVYEGRWRDAGGLGNMYLPDGYIIAIGCRPDAATPGNYVLTPSSNGCPTFEGKQGMWVFYKDTCGEEMVRTITLGMGHQAIPLIYYPESVFVAKVF